MAVMAGWADPESAFFDRYLVAVAWEMGLGVKQIREEVLAGAGVKVSEQTVRNWVTGMGYAPKRARVTDEEKREWLRMWEEEGLTGMAIAKRVGRDRTVVTKALGSLGAVMSRGRRSGS